MEAPFNGIIEDIIKLAAFYIIPFSWPKLSAAKHVSLERVIHEISHESLESEDSDNPTTPPYIIPCRHDLSTSQKKIIEERVRAIRSEVPIYVTVMKNNNAGAAQRWMLVSSILFLVLNNCFGS
jgi:hypothetical protein